MKTSEDIKESLEKCGRVRDCHKFCAYWDIGDCTSALYNDTLAYIQQLEEALLLMIYQYCQEDDSHVSHRYMVAGEHAFAALGIENYCSIETIEKKLDEMEGIHITPPPEPPKERNEDA